MTKIYTVLNNFAMTCHSCCPIFRTHIADTNGVAAGSSLARARTHIAGANVVAAGSSLFTDLGVIW